MTRIGDRRDRAVRPARRVGAVVALLVAVHSASFAGLVSRPDTPTRRLYEVDASSHVFGGGREQFFRDLDDALNWIESRGGRPATQ